MKKSTVDRIALFLGLAGVMIGGVTFGLPGDQSVVTVTGGLFAGFGTMWVWRALK